MVLLNEHVILEIALYLDVPDLLSLALSSRIPFRASQLYSFWRPHELDAFSGFSAFLPVERVGPWRSYSGDDIRVAAMKMGKCKDNWQSDRPVAKYRVSMITKGGILLEIPGTRWLYYFQRDSNNVLITHFIDGRTGHRTVKGIDIVPPGTNVGDESPAVFALGPDEILIGDSGGNDDNTWDFALFRVKLFFEEKDGNVELKVYQTQINLWKDVPPSPTATANAQFLLLRSSEDEPYEQISIYDIYSSKSCTLPEAEVHKNTFLRDDWYFMGFNHSNELYLAAIHLPTLLTSGKTIDWPELLDGIGTPIGSRYGVSSIGFCTSVNSFSNRAEYTVILYDLSGRFIINVRLEVAVDSIYGQIILAGQLNRISAEADLQRAISYHKVKPNERYISHYSPHIPPSCQGPLALLAGHGTGNPIYVADFCQSMPLRCVEWRASIRHCGKADSKDTEPASETDLVQWKMHRWDPKVGVLVLKEAQMPSPDTVYHICWF